MDYAAIQRQQFTMFKMTLNTVQSTNTEGAPKINK